MSVRARRGAATDSPVALEELTHRAIADYYARRLAAVGREVGDSPRRAAHPRRDHGSAGVRTQTDAPGQPANKARFVFLAPLPAPRCAADSCADRDHVANEVVAILRSEAGREPYDSGLSDLIGQPSPQNETFRTKWAAHSVRFHDTGIKRLHHPVVGDHRRRGVAREACISAQSADSFL
ncbi:MAG: hypothetical protein M3071_05845 [Actinomycetota bacterium]|nr:hypothetical protein [Actinomycetota bacterium]